MTFIASQHVGAVVGHSLLVLRHSVRRCSSGILLVCWGAWRKWEGGLGSPGARGAVGAAPACRYQSEDVWGVEENNSSVKGTCLKMSDLLNGFAL